MSGRLTEKVALVTGAARGMGRAEAQLFAAEGAQVVLTDVLDDEGQNLADELGRGARYLHLDVTSEDEWSSVVRSTVDTLGRLDILVNNAGIAEPASLVETSLASYRRVVEVNQIGVFLGMRSVVEAMTAAGGGSIINVSSIDGLAGMNHLTSYVASKWAVRGMTKTAAMELGPLGIRVNSIHPGFIHTHMGTRDGFGPDKVAASLDTHTVGAAPLGRSGRPEEIARLALFLASDDASYSTGSEFVADGGLTAGFPAPGTDGRS